MSDRVEIIILAVSAAMLWYNFIVLIINPKKMINDNIKIFSENGKVSDNKMDEFNSKIFYYQNLLISRISVIPAIILTVFLVHKIIAK